MKLSKNLVAVGALSVLVGMLIVSRVIDAGAADRERLLDAMNQDDAPVNVQIMSSDDKLRTYIYTYGLVPTMRALVATSLQIGIDCHERAHQFGRMSYGEFGDEVLKLNLPECHSGFYHGAIEAYFKKNGTANLQEKLPTICPHDLNEFYSHQCMHGLGHGLMAWSNYDLPSSLEYCNLLQNSSAQSSCRTGIFMENLIGSLTDSPEARQKGHFTRYVSSDPQYPCTIVKDEYKVDCYFLQTDRMRVLSKTGWQGVADECGKAPEGVRYSCFASMGRTISGELRSQNEKVLEACRSAPAGQMREYCIDGAAKDTFWDRDGQNVGLRFCEAIPPEDGKGVCYAALLVQAHGVLKDAEYQAFCDKLPEAHRAQCIAQTPAA